MIPALGDTIAPPPIIEVTNNRNLHSAAPSLLPSSPPANKVSVLDDPDAEFSDHDHQDDYNIHDEDGY